MQWYAAPAKLNLFLHVVGRRGDGYHLLQTVFRLIDLYDEVGIMPRWDGEIVRVDSIEGVALHDDLCWRAARRLKDYALARTGSGANPLGADIALKKRIPVGGGMGGGSSDAATVLLVLNRLWDLNLARAELIEIALSLGADVPAFVFGESALGEGVGEVLTPVVLPAAWYLVLVPQVSVSTREIFGDAALTRDTEPLKMQPFFTGMGRNDLEPIAASKYPEIASHLAWLRGWQSEARMTGSGACVFAEFDTEGSAREVHAQLPQAMCGLVARGLDRHPLHEWAW